VIFIKGKALLFLKKKKQKDFLYCVMGIDMAKAHDPDSGKFLVESLVLYTFGRTGLAARSTSV
jgi:hypothetical protein